MNTFVYYAISKKGIHFGTLKESFGSDARTRLDKLFPRHDFFGVSSDERHHEKHMLHLFLDILQASGFKAVKYEDELLGHLGPKEFMTTDVKVSQNLRLEDKEVTITKTYTHLCIGEGVLVFDPDEGLVEAC